MNFLTLLLTQLMLIEIQRHSADILMLSLNSTETITPALNAEFEFSSFQTILRIFYRIKIARFEFNCNVISCFIYRGIIGFFY